MIVRVYHRLSRATDDSTSIARQREACAAAAARKWPGAEVVVYEDVDISGYADVRRPDFERLLADVKAHRGEQGLVVYRIDRLTRRGARHLLELVEDDLQPHGCALVSATEPVDTTGPFGELFLTVLAVFAKMESQRIGERQVATQAFLRSQGRWTGGPPPFGYRVVSADSGKRLEPEPEDAAIVRRVAQDVLSGVPLSKASQGMTYQGWYKLLRNPTIAGYQTFDRQILFDDDGEPVQSWPPVLEPSVWRQLQPILDSRTSRGQRRAARTSLLGGLAICERCGSPLTGARRQAPAYSTYQCTRRGGCRDVGKSTTISMSKLDAFVLGSLSVLLPDLLAHTDSVPDEPVDDEAARLAAVRDYLDEQMDRMLFDERRSPDDPDVQRLQVRIDRARQEAVELRARPGGTPPAALASVVSGGSVFDMSLDRQRRLVELVFHVEIAPPSRPKRWDPSRITLRMKDGLEVRREGGVDDHTADA